MHGRRRKHLFSRVFKGDLPCANMSHSIQNLNANCSLKGNWLITCFYIRLYLGNCKYLALYSYVRIDIQTPFQRNLKLTLLQRRAVKRVGKRTHRIFFVRFYEQKSDLNSLEIGKRLRLSSRVQSCSIFDRPTVCLSVCLSVHCRHLAVEIFLHG